MRLISKLIFIPVAAVFVIFAIANRKPVTLEMWPLPFAIDLPLYLAVLGALVIGILIGGGTQWISDGRWRRRARRSDRRANSLERELTAARDAAPASETATASLPAAGPGRPAGTLLPRIGQRSKAR